MKCFLQTCGNYEVEELEAQNGAKKLLQTTPLFNCECQKRFQKREKKRNQANGRKRDSDPAKKMFKK
jgi:hypothetical protein